MPSLTEELAGILRRPVGAAERQRAAIHLRDWLACAFLGASADAGRALAEYGRRQAAGRCSAIAAGGRSAEVAAFVNGGLGNIFELDDTHRLSVLHPGDTAIPAALAISEREGRGGDALLDAIVRGYEATIRIGVAAGTGHYRHWYSTATCGVFGAAAAAASVLRLDSATTVHALANAGMQFAGVWQCRMEPGFAKQLAAARAAQAGVAAADLAAIGFTGPRQILEGEHGLFAATGANGAAGAVAAAPDAPWKIWETSFKPWPACRATHPVIEAALIARSKIDLAAVADIDVEIFSQAVAMCDQPAPQTPHEGRFSLQHCAAIALLCGAPSLAHFEPAWLNRADVAALRSKVKVRASADLTAAFPSRLGVSLGVGLSDGDRVRFELWTAKGDPENPMTEAELEEKAWELMSAAGLGRGAIERLLAALGDVERGRSVATLTAALAACGERKDRALRAATGS